MLPSVTTLPIHQAKRLAGPVHVRTESGLLWVTVDGQPEDILLAAGESRRFADGAGVIVYALGAEARYLACTRTPARPSAASSAAGWARRAAGRWTAWLRTAGLAWGGRA